MPDRSEVSYLDFKDVMGQEIAKRALEIAAAGGHNVLFIGPPGSGKSMLAKRIPSILPDMTWKESLEVTQIYSVMGMLTPDSPMVMRRPFRAPHHTISNAGLIGGGSTPRPGEISMAHKGVLFLDEVPEFKRVVLDAMRQPLEEKQIVFLRSGMTYTFPTDVMLVAAMNPCPCGYYPDKNRCVCLPHQVQKYVGHISGPILDRIDVVAETLTIKNTGNTFFEKAKITTSAMMREQVIAARTLQKLRYEAFFPESECKWNGNLSGREIERVCILDNMAEKLFDKLLEKFSLSGRACCSLLKVARTIADLDGSEKIEERHLAEAAGYRLGFERYFYG